MKGSIRERTVCLETALCLLVALTWAWAVWRPVLAGETRGGSGWVEDCGPAAADSKPRHAEPPPPSHFQLSERLDPLPAELSAGRIFSLSLFSQYVPRNQWQRIPHWLAGSWRVDAESIAEESGFRSIRLHTIPMTVRPRETWRFGMQRDAKGGIWHFTKLPALRKVDLDGRTEYRVKTSERFARAGIGRVVYFSRMLVVRVENSTGVILDCRQQESLASMVPDSGKHMKVSASLRVFDTAGVAATTSASELTLTRTKAFAPLDTYNGERTDLLFRAFLEADPAGGLLDHGP